MTVYESVSEAIGNTPLVRLRALPVEGGALVYAKVEFVGIGGSVKDRAARSMIEAAERDGSLRPGGTIVEGTSGNTGIGLAIVGRQRGYRVIVGVSEKSADEKVDILKAYGAEVVRASTTVPKQHPDHLFWVVRRIAAGIPGAWLANQYDNPANPDAHRHSTGPEIWRQTGGRVTHFVAGIGTGGTITGTGEYLKEVSGGSVTVVGADPEASVFSGGDGSPYFVESIGHFVHPGTDEDVWPESFHPAVVDRFERIGDRESLLTIRRLAREEGLLAGASSGTALAAALRVARDLPSDDLVVVLLPDSGRSYLSRYFDDGWLRASGFLEEAVDGPTVRSVLGRLEPLRAVESTVTVGAAVAAHPEGPAVVPVVLARRERHFGPTVTEILGAVDLSLVQANIAAGGVDPGEPVLDHLDSALPTIGVGESLADAAAALDPDRDAALVLVDGRVVARLSGADLA